MKTKKTKLPKAQMGLITKGAKTLSTAAKVGKAAEAGKTLKDLQKINNAAKGTKTAQSAESIRHAKQLAKWIGQGMLLGGAGAYGLKKYAESEKAKTYKKPTSKGKTNSKKG